MRYPALQGKRDANEPQIIAALEAAGATVEQLPTGRGLADLLVGFTYIDDLWCTCRDNYLIEVKTPKGKLNSKQIKWHNEWNGQVAVVRTPEEALAVIGVDIPLDDRVRRAGQ